MYSVPSVLTISLSTTLFEHSNPLFHASLSQNLPSWCPTIRSGFVRYQPEVRSPRLRLTMRLRGRFHRMRTANNRRKYRSECIRTAASVIWVGLRDQVQSWTLRKSIYPLERNPQRRSPTGRRGCIHVLTTSVFVDSFSSFATAQLHGHDGMLVREKFLVLGLQFSFLDTYRFEQGT